MRLKVFPQAFVLFLLLAITLALIWSRPEHQPELQDLAPTPVVVGSVQQTQLEPVEQVSGYLQPVRKVALQFQVAGRVAARHAEPGLRVETGQLLLELEAGDYQDAVIQARADWEQVQDNLKRDQRLLELAQKSRKLQEAEVARLNSLIERSLASKSRIGEAEALLATRFSEQARLRSSVGMGPQRIAASKAKLDSAERNLQRAQLTAPFNGRVNAVFLNSGDYAAQNQQAVELIDEQLDFYAMVRGEVARALHIDDEVVVQVGGGQSTARVVAVQPDPDPQTFTHEIRLRMPAEETRSGISARASLPLEKLENVLVVPVTALVQEEGAVFVYGVKDDKLLRKPVILGTRFDQQQVITEGLVAGEQIVIRDVAALSDGQPVVINQDPS